MARQLSIRFDANQDYQKDAIQSVVGLFDGLPRHVAEFALNDDITANLPEHESLSESWLQNNLFAVQSKSQIPPGIEGLTADEGLVIEGAGTETWRYPSFTIEMET